MKYQNRQPAGMYPNGFWTNGGGNRSFSAAAGGITERSLQPGFLPVWLRIILPKRIRRSTRGAGSVSGFGTVYSAEAYIGPEVRKLPGSGRRGAGRRDAAARPQGGRAFGACGAKASAPSSVYGPARLLQRPMPEAGSVSFLRDTGAKRKGALHPPCGTDMFCSGLQGCSFTRPER